MAKTPFYLRKAQTELIRSRYADRPTVQRLRLLGTKVQFLADDIWYWLSAPRVIALLMLVGGALGLALDYAYQRSHLDAGPMSMENNVFIALSPEFISIAIGILIIDWANGRVQHRQQVEALIHQLRSASTSLSQDALAELRTYSWLYDGTLEGEDLTQANLQDADLLISFLYETEDGSIVRQRIQPKLKGADLKFICLKGANLAGADLGKADLLAADLRGARLSGANLQLANLHAAECSGADFRGAALQGSNLTDANLKDALIGESIPICDRKTVLPDGTHWSSNQDLYRFVNQNNADFWQAPLFLHADSGLSDYQEEASYG
jgi:uncharacterized protein YjbI with pentapeptide repeats